MKSVYRFTAAFALFVSNAASATVQAHLSLNPTRTLPGLSVYVRTHVQNDDSQLTLARLVRVRVTPDQGEAFLATWGNGKDYGALDIIDDRDLTLEVSNSVDLFLAPKDLANSSWALDRRLVPGRYTIELIFYAAEDTHEPLTVSSPASLEISQPNQRDAEIWAAVSSHKGGPELADAVLRNSPDSPYLPYLAGWFLRDTQEERIAVFRQVVDLHPNSPMASRLRLWLAKLYEDASTTSFSKTHDVDAAARIAESERTILENLVHGKDEWGKLNARRILDNGIPTRAGYLEMKRRYF